MIDVQDAVKIANGYFHKIYPNVSVYYLQVEEVELSDDRKFWAVTLGYRTSPSALEKTKLRVFKINAISGEVLAMKMRSSNDS